MEQLKYVVRAAFEKPHKPFLHVIIIVKFGRNICSLASCSQFPCNLVRIRCNDSVSMPLHRNMSVIADVCGAHRNIVFFPPSSFPDYIELTTPHPIPINSQKSLSFAQIEELCSFLVGNFGQWPHFPSFFFHFIAYKWRRRKENELMTVSAYDVFEIRQSTLDRTFFSSVEISWKWLDSNEASYFILHYSFERKRKKCSSSRRSIFICKLLKMHSIMKRANARKGNVSRWIMLIIFFLSPPTGQWCEACAHKFHEPQKMFFLFNWNENRQGKCKLKT